jgi:hypothetical protein
MENQNLTEQRNALMLFLWNNRKSLMLFTGAAAVISIIISFFCGKRFFHFSILTIFTTSESV